MAGGTHQPHHCQRTDAGQERTESDQPRTPTAADRGKSCRRTSPAGAAFDVVDDVVVTIVPLGSARAGQGSGWCPLPTLGAGRSGAESSPPGPPRAVRRTGQNIHTPHSSHSEQTRRRYGKGPTRLYQIDSTNIHGLKRTPPATLASTHVAPRSSTPTATPIRRSPRAGSPTPQATHRDLPPIGVWSSAGPPCTAGSSRTPGPCRTASSRTPGQPSPRSGGRQDAVPAIPGRRAAATPSASGSSANRPWSARRDRP